MTFANATFRHYRLWCIWIFSIVLLYTLIGFLLLPWLAERQLVKTLQQRLGVQASIEKIKFNPYSFELVIDNLQLTTSHDEQLASWSKLYINQQPTQLVKLNLSIEEINIVSPKLHFRRYSETDNTLIRLTDKWTQTASLQTKDDVDQAKLSAQEPPVLTLEINKMISDGGELYVRDEVPETVFETVLAPINIQLDHFSTQAGQTASQNLLIGLENEAVLKLNGNLVMSPLHLQGQIALENLSLQTPYRYLQAQLPFELNDGRLDLKLAYNVNLAESTVDIDLNGIELEMAEFGIHQPRVADALLDGGILKVSNGHFTYPALELSIDSISLDDFKLLARQNKQGEVNWLQLLASFPAQQTKDAPADSKSQPLKLNITSIAINNTKLEIKDQRPETPVELSLLLAASMQNFTLAAENRMAFTTDISLESGGTIDLQGELQLFPALAVQTSAVIKALEMQPIQSYLDKYAYIDVVNGHIDSTINLQTDQQDPLALQGNLALTSFQLDNQKLKEKLLSFEKLAVNTIDFSVAQKHLSVSEVIVDTPYSRILNHKNSETNISQLLKAQPVIENQQDDVMTAKPSPNYAISVGQIKITDGSSHFTDENLPIIFDAYMQELNGEISGFSTRSKQAVDIALEGKVDKFGLVEIKGLMNPINIKDQTMINLAFSNLDLPKMSPYAIKFAGREIAEGRGDVELTYQINNGDLKATNNIVISNIRLGERVESPDALDLPLDLAVALLKNSDGVIELKIPVTGNVNDPEFDMGPVIRAAITNAIRNIVTAPFRFLASLFGSDDQSISNIRFQAGRSDLTPPEQEKLLKLITALEQRPQLVLNIPAPFNETTDRPPLQLQAIEEKIETYLSETDSEQQLVLRRQAILERLYTEASLSPDLQVIEFELTIQAEPPSDAELDVLAYNARLKDRLVEVESITDYVLNDLARARQSTTLEFIKKHSQLQPNQLQITDVVSEKLDEGWLTMPFELGAIK
jgi:hypothetical protein